VANNTSDLDLMQIINSNLAAIGITVNVTLMDNASWGTYCISNKKSVANEFLATADRLVMLIRRLDSYNCSEPVTAAITVLSAILRLTLIILQPLQPPISPRLNQLFLRLNLYVAQQHFGVSIVSRLLLFCPTLAEGLQW